VSEAAKTLKDDPAASRQCYWKVAGERCQETGTLSPSLHGKGPYFCSQHFETYLSTKPKQQNVDLPIDQRVAHGKALRQQIADKLMGFCQRWGQQR
jgi:hypothetical protein